MKRVLLFLIVILFLTGCNINYTLNIDEYFEENASVIESNYNNWSYSFSGMSMMEYNDYYLQKEIPYHYNDSYVPEDFVRFDNVLYYDVDDLSNDNRIGLSLSGKFKSAQDFSGSNLIWKSCTNKSITQNDDSISIKVSGFKLFDEFKNLDKINVNIKSKYSFLSDNADSVKDNIYTWVITRDNYDKKSIDVILKTSNIIEDVVRETKDNSMTYFTLVLVFLVVVCFTLYKWVLRKYDKNNSL